MSEWHTSFSVKNNSNYTKISEIALHDIGNLKKIAQGFGTAKLRSYAKFRIWKHLFCRHDLRNKSVEFLIFSLCLKHDPNNSYSEYRRSYIFFCVVRVQLLKNTLKSDTFEVFCIFQGEKKSWQHNMQMLVSSDQVLSKHKF